MTAEVDLVLETVNRYSSLILRLRGASVGHNTATFYARTFCIDIYA